MRSILQSDLEEAAQFGADGAGVTRFAWSTELLGVNAWLASRLSEAGLEVKIDAAGNVFGKWQAGSGKAILVGSHLDTVPCGGRYDGALGVLGALHAIRTLKAQGVLLRRPIWLVSFNDEEGARFGTGLLGSRAFVGDDLASLGERGDSNGITLREAMAAAGFNFDLIHEARAVDEIDTYLELHIEQGPVLEHVGADVGVSTGIVGVIVFQARLIGEANHAGTTPMTLRRDALAGAARGILALRHEALGCDQMTANVGVISAKPGGFNVIPGACEFTIDVRSTTEEGCARAEQFVRDTLHDIAAEENLDLELHVQHRLRPARLDVDLQRTLDQAADSEGAKSIRMTTGAGHDAMMLARHVRSGMLFVPSRGGISHSPAEFTTPEQCELGTRVLARALALLAA